MGIQDRKYSPVFWEITEQRMLKQNVASDFILEHPK